MKRTRVKRTRRWLLDHLPSSVLRHPAEFFIIFLLGTGGVPYLLGVTRSGSLSQLLPEYLVRGWGAALTVGAIFLLCGLTSVRVDAANRELIARPACYKLGLRLMIAAGMIYGTALLFTVGPRALLAVSAVFIFAGYCAVRLLVISGSEDTAEERDEEARR